MMDKLTRSLIDSNRRMRQGLEAIRDGHEAGARFLEAMGYPRPDHLPGRLLESVALAEEVATVAMGVPSDPELTNTLLRRLLLTFGDHIRGCPDSWEGEGTPCECSWATIYAKLMADTAPIDRDGTPEAIP